MRRRTGEEIESDKTKVAELLREFHVSQKAVEYLVVKRRLTASDIEKRLRALREANVPLNGIVWKLSLESKKFQGLVSRYASPNKFTPAQEEVYQFLKSKQVSKSIALRIARLPLVRPQQIKDRVAYLESIVLDPNIYGVERIPVRYWQRVVDRELNDLKRQKLVEVLDPLEDKHSAKIIARNYPGKLALVKRGVRASALLKRLLAADATGTAKTNTILLRRSSRRIAGLQAKTVNALNRQAVMEQLVGTKMFENLLENKGGQKSVHDLMRYIAEQTMRRPHLKIQRKWLTRQIVGKPLQIGDTQRVYSRSTYDDAIGRLITIGVLSKSNGTYAISNWFRMGHNGLNDMLFRANRRIETVSRKARARHQARKA